MPMIDVYAPSDLLPSGSERRIGQELTRAVLRAEGVSVPGQFHLENTAAFIHRMEPATVQTAAHAVARTIRVQIMTTPGALSRSGQKQLVRDVTTILADICADPWQAKRTWVLLTEAAEGGWGIAGAAFGREEFAALAEQPRQPRRKCDDMPGAQPKRCSWVNVDDQLMRDYHDREWGVPTHDDRRHFEFLVLEAAQAGLSWSIVLNKREGYRRAFSQFDPEKVARYSPARIDRLTADPRIIRNRIKIAAAVKNARAFLAVQKEYGSFDAYCWQFVNGRPRQNRWKSLRQIPATTAESDAFSRDLKRRGFGFVGSTVIYAHMQAVGIVNDHLVDCYRYRDVRALGTPET
jgi:DNA-3-methyladenine glycosylase I